MSIYEFLKCKTPGELEASDHMLPDSAELTQSENAAWVPGAYEGIILRSDMRIKQHLVLNHYIARQIRKYVLHPSETLYKKIECFPVKYSAISLADPICSICVALKLIQTPERKASLRKLAVKLALESSKREAVKLGIALLGISGTPEDIELIMPLGMHDEFTLYAAGTVSRLLEGKEEASAHGSVKNKYLIELAGSVNGWGKIAIMYELDYSDYKTRLWAVKHGCRNSIGLSYAANVCAVKGRMADILKAMSECKSQEDDENSDKDIFRGVCDIFTGLLDPEENNDGINEYPDGYESARYFINICRTRPEIALCDARSEKIADRLENLFKI